MRVEGRVSLMMVGLCFYKGLRGGERSHRFKLGTSLTDNTGSMIQGKGGGDGCGRWFVREVDRLEYSIVVDDVCAQIDGCLDIVPRTAQEVSSKDVLVKGDGLCVLAKAREAPLKFSVMVAEDGIKVEIGFLVDRVLVVGATLGVEDSTVEANVLAGLSERHFTAKS